MEKTLRTLLFILYPLVVVCMAVATIVEKHRGTDYVSAHIYGAWWFSALWAALAVAGVAWMVRRHMRQWPLVLLHGGLAVVLAGALVTHLTRWQGMARVRTGTDTHTILLTAGRHAGTQLDLPFTLRLDSFTVQRHAGSDDAANYISAITLTDGQGSTRHQVMMNHTVQSHGITIMQSAYDSDGLGSVLAFSSDPVGTPLTYTGYGLLFMGVIAMLLHRGGTFRRLLRSPLLRQASLGVALLAAMALMPRTAVAASAGDGRLPATLPRAEASHMGALLILHNGRVCPLQTFALDFTRKLCGASTYKGLSAEQVLAGWMFWPDEWAAEPMIKTGHELQATLMLPARTSFNQFFNRDMGGYILGPYVQESYGGAQDKFHRDVMAVDERLQLVVDLRRGASLRLFPFTIDGRVQWLAPTDSLPAATQRGHEVLVRALPELLRADALSADYAHLALMVDKLKALQLRDGGASVPTATQLRAERMYNAVPFNTILFMLNLTMGLLLLVAGLARMGRTPAPRRATTLAMAGQGHDPRRQLMGRVARHWGRRLARALPVAVMVAAFATLTLFGALRWVVSGTVPMANGFETMLLIAWLVMLLSLLCCRRLPMVLCFGFLMSGFFLLVSHISQMDPQITHVMPVLNSPLLGIHVSIIMLAFALLSITFICAVTALMAALRLRVAKGHGARGAEAAAGAHGTRVLEAYAVVSRLFLYPAIAALTIGIFVGAVWAERSWGVYWGWDPKETWALITLMIYAVPLHTGTVGALRRPMAYHVFMALAFLSIVMTYFGVNYFLGGMHSYA